MKWAGAMKDYYSCSDVEQNVPYDKEDLLQFGKRIIAYKFL